MCIRDRDGTVACWGLNAADNQLVFGANQYKTVALADSGRTCAQRSTTDQLDCYRGVPAIGFAQWGGFGFKQISAGGTRTCGVSASGLGTCAVNMAFEFLFTGSWQRIEAGLDHACGLKPDGSLAVSYTHLDVYKRQLLLGVGGERRNGVRFTFASNLRK